MKSLDAESPDEVAVRRAAMDLLARREHSRLELMQKLGKRFPGESALIEQSVDRLADEGLQSDARLAEAFIRARSNKGQGPVKIRSELRGKGVSDAVIGLAMEECEIDWVEQAGRVAARKFARGQIHVGGDDDVFSMEEVFSMRNAAASEKARVSRFLQQRGFSFDHISSLF